MLISQMSFEKTFGLSSVFIESTLMENGGVPESVNPSMLIKEAIHVISCGYEEKTAWGKEVLTWLIMSISLLVLRHAAYFFHAAPANLATSQFFVRGTYSQSSCIVQIANFLNSLYLICLYRPF